MEISVAKARIYLIVSFLYFGLRFISVSTYSARSVSLFLHATTSPFTPTVRHFAQLITACSKYLSSSNCSCCSTTLVCWTE